MLHSALKARSHYTAVSLSAPQHSHRIVVMGVVCPRWRHHRLMADGKRPIPQNARQLVLFQGIRPSSPTFAGEPLERLKRVEK